MNFLAWYNPLSWLGDVKDEIIGSIVKSVRTMFYQLSVTIYKIVIYLYNTFETLCNARILNDDIIQQLASRIGLILGIIMLFMVTISFIQMLLEPDNVNDKEKGAVNVIKKVLIVIVMFGVSNFAFSALYQFQKVVINSNIISKFILPNNVDTDKFGGVLASELFIAFYDVDPILKDSIDTSDSSIDFEDGDPEFCQYLVYGLKTNIANDYNFELGYYCLNEHIDVYMPNTPSSEKKQQIHIIDFNLLLSPIVGCICIWMLFSYCIMVGTRVIIIAFLEIISPMAFISYLSPKKDTMFSKWLKLYTATYLDAFIRIAIINFVVFLIATIFTYGETNTFWNSVDNPDGFTKKFIMVLIVLSLLTFAKKAPEMLKQLFPNNGGILGYGMTPKQMFDNMLFGNAVSWVPKAATGVVGGALGGAAIGLLGGGFGGFAGGLLKGGLSGLKGQGFMKTISSAAKSQANANRSAREWRNAGGTNIFGRTWASMQQSVGAMTTADLQDAAIKEIEELIQREKDHTANERRTAKIYDAVRNSKKKIEDRAESKLLNGSFKIGDVRYNMQQTVLRAQAKIQELEEAGASAADIAKAKAAYNNILDTTKKAYINASYNHLFTDAAMEAMQEDIRTTIANNANEFSGMSTNITNFASLDRFDTEVTIESSKINRTISNSDVIIQGYEDQILKQKTSDEYRSAHANKGYKGGNH